MLCLPTFLPLHGVTIRSFPRISGLPQEKPPGFTRSDLKEAVLRSPESRWIDSKLLKAAEPPAEVKETL